MTKTELKEFLEKALQDGDLDTEWFSMLQDASIHAAMILGIELPVASAVYAQQCIGHIVIVGMFGDEEPTSIEGLINSSHNPDSHSGSESKPRARKPVTEEERAKLDAIIPKDLNLDL